MTLREVTRDIRSGIEIVVNGAYLVYGGALLLFAIFLIFWDIVKSPFRTPVCACGRANTITTHISAGIYGIVRCPSCSPTLPESQRTSNQIPRKDIQPVLSVGLNSWVPVVQPQNLKPGAFQPQTCPTRPTEQVQGLHL